MSSFRTLRPGPDPTCTTRVGHRCAVVLKRCDDGVARASGRQDSIGARYPTLQTARTLYQTISSNFVLLVPKLELQQHYVDRSGM
eukprot:6202217-Pleurochrysis_carterae.AAC.2